jgi:hypothetical protein
MSNDPHSELDFPTCAEAAGIGFAAIPDMLWDMEDDCGAEVMKAMVLAYGGLELTVSKIHHFPWERDPLIQGRAWLWERLGPGSVRIPKGPGTRSARVAWTAFRLLRDGASLSAVSLATGCDMRTISNIKRKLRGIGALPEKDTFK